MSARIRISALVLTAALAATARAGEPAAEKKVPITTTSAQAREAFLRGRDLSEKLRGQQAREQFEQAVQLDPDFALAWLNLAGTQPTTKVFFETMAKAVALEDKVSPGEKLMIQAGEAGGNGDNAAQVKYCEQLVAQYPGDERALNLLGNAHFGAQRYPQAIELYEKAVMIAPDFSTPYNQLGYSYRFTGNPAKAEIAFKKYIELIPDDPNPYDSYAELLLKTGRFDESITMYRKALAIDPSFVASHLGIATDLDLLGRSAEARKEIDAMLQGAKDDGQVRAGLFAKTVSYAHEGNYAAAQAELEKQYALGEKTDDVLAMSGDQALMGNLALETGDAAGAEARYRRASELVEGAKSVPEANRENQRRLISFRAARVALARKDLATARTQSAAFTEKVASSGNVFMKRLAHELAGQVAIADKRYDDAIAELGQANPLDPYNMYRLSLAYAGKGDAAKAKEYAAQAAGDNTLTSLNYAFVRKHMHKIEVTKRGETKRS